MFKKFASFLLYWHYILDTILTYVIVLFFINTKFTSLAALFLSMDSILKLLLSVFLSRLVVRFSPQIRGRMSVILRLTLIGMWFILIEQIEAYNSSMFIIVAFILFKVAILLDSYLSADFVFLMKEYFNIDFNQNSAAQNMIVRSCIMIAPTGATMIFSMPDMKTIILIFAIILGTLSIIFLRRVFFPSIEPSFTSRPNQPKSFTNLILNPLMRWGIFFHVFVNLAFAGVAFLFLSDTKFNEKLFLNEISLLYVSFFIFQVFVFVFGEKIVMASKCLHISIIIGICGILVIISSISNTPIRLITCCGIGLTYSFSLSAIQKILTSKLRGPGFIEYVGWIQMISRLTSFLIMIVLGLAISSGISPSVLLMSCGFLGILAAIFLGLITLRPLAFR